MVSEESGQTQQTFGFTWRAYAEAHAASVREQAVTVHLDLYVVTRFRFDIGVEDFAATGADPE